ncbi:hypothetical protein BOTCAL_0001g00370 [Botryotinia calthae]|uniref:Uncharacterized protein n=1 Tax=Botryotinia calthae TaxID=38488 RepID=A0A4Y8DID5_9HELO|nr:hypothetical protein BOTCAL_0001g00370 [Botryotinia calthae]
MYFASVANFHAGIGCQQERGTGIEKYTLSLPMSKRSVKFWRTQVRTTQASMTTFTESDDEENTEQENTEQVVDRERDVEEKT